MMYNIFISNKNQNLNIDIKENYNSYKCSIFLENELYYIITFKKYSISECFLENIISKVNNYNYAVLFIEWFCKKFNFNLYSSYNYSNDNEIVWNMLMRKHITILIDIFTNEEYTENDIGLKSKSGILIECPNNTKNKIYEFNDFDSDQRWFWLIRFK